MNQTIMRLSLCVFLWSLSGEAANVSSAAQEGYYLVVKSNNIPPSYITEAISEQFGIETNEYTYLDRAYLIELAYDQAKKLIQNMAWFYQNYGLEFSQEMDVVAKEIQGEKSCRCCLYVLEPSQNTPKIIKTLIEHFLKEEIELPKLIYTSIKVPLPGFEHAKNLPTTHVIDSGILTVKVTDELKYDLPISLLTDESKHDLPILPRERIRQPLPQHRGIMEKISNAIWSVFARQVN